MKFKNPKHENEYHEKRKIKDQHKKQRKDKNKIRKNKTRVVTKKIKIPSNRNFDT